MSGKNPIVWTPFQRRAVVDFLRLYADKLEETMDDPGQDYGLHNVQKGVLHLADKVLPSQLTYVVNEGPKGSIRENIKVILSNEEHEAFENARSK